MKINEIPKIKHLDSGNFFLIAGPCVVENEEMPFEIAEQILQVANRLKIPFIFKASYKKANRSRPDSFTTMGERESMEIIKNVGKIYSIPTITDIHTVTEAEMAADYVDLLQIPAFLCRQTELLVAAGKTGKVVNIKKGQFASPAVMQYAIEKVQMTGNQNVMLTERGTTFGYEDLIVDFRNVPLMKKLGVPVVVDITHSLQQPNQVSGVTGGHPELIETIGKASIAVGADGIFLETHPNPAMAKSDGANMLNLDLLEDLLEKLVKIRRSIT
jgi:2-dehydro-3-deoxyphosphooctonate aldolase (KDO 8-P synthase)